MVHSIASLDSERAMGKATVVRSCEVCDGVIRRHALTLRRDHGDTRRERLPPRQLLTSLLLSCIGEDECRMLFFYYLKENHRHELRNALKRGTAREGRWPTRGEAVVSRQSRAAVSAGTDVISVSPAPWSRTRVGEALAR